MNKRVKGIKKMKIKRMLCVLCALSVMFGTVGCSAGMKSDEGAVQAAIDKFAACNSFRAVQRSERRETVAAEGLSYDYSGLNETAVELVYSPEAKMKSSVTVRHEFDGELTEQSALSYLLPENGGYTEYYNDGTGWYKLSTEETDILSGSYADSVARAFYVGSLEFGRAGVDELDSGKAQRYEAALGGEALVSYLEASGHLLSIAEMSENQQSKIKENLAKDLKSIPVKIWVDKASGYPVRFELSTTSILEDMEKSIARSLGNRTADIQWAVTEYTVSTTVSDFDAIGDIVLPEEAASAGPYEPILASDDASAL